MARRYCKVKKKEAAAVKIQKNSRTMMTRKAYSNVKAAAIVLQAWLRARAAVRAMAALSELRHRKHAKGALSIQVWPSWLCKSLRIFIVVQIDNYSKCLQTSWRGHRDFSYYKKLRKASVFSQSRWRGIAARREFRKLKMVGIHLLLWSSYWWIIYFKSYRWVYALNFIFWIPMWNLPTVPTYIFSVAENLSMLICSCTKHLRCHSVTLTFTSAHSVRATNDQYEVCLSIVIEIFWHVSHFETKW